MLEISYKKVRRGPCYKFLFSILSGGASDEEIVDFNIDDLIMVHLKFTNTGDDGGSHVVYVSLIKHIKQRDSVVRMNVSCGIVSFNSECNWTLLSRRPVECRHRVFLSNLEVSISAYKVDVVGFANLYDDTDLTDFALVTSDGTVAVHKACLAAHSDFFRRMLANQWKETAERSIEIKGLTVKNLEHFKEYLYLGTLPEEPDELRLLLILAAQYLLEKLKKECIIKLVQSLTPENYFSLHDLACAYNIPELTIAITDQAPDDVINCAYNLRSARDARVLNPPSPPRILRIG